MIENLNDDSAATHSFLLLRHFATSLLTLQETQTRLQSVLCLSSQMGSQSISQGQLVKALELLELHDECEKKFIPWTRTPPLKKSRSTSLLQLSIGLQFTSTESPRLLKQTLLKCAFKAHGQSVGNEASKEKPSEFIGTRSSPKSIFEGIFSLTENDFCNTKASKFMISNLDNVVL
jgi:hypothetical protein